MRDFDKLNWAARIGHAKLPFLLLTFEWSDKRQHIGMYQADIPDLRRAFVERKHAPHKGHANMRAVDVMPGLRLAAACEGLANAVYAACDIAAMFAHRASKSLFASSFNGICHQIKKGAISADWFGGVANLDWYARVREMRTEWTHHSTVFIGAAGEDGEPRIVLKPLRRRSDRVILPERTLLRVQDVLDWAGKAVHVVDCFGLTVYTQFVLPQLDLDDTIWDLTRDEQGFPVPNDSGGLQGTRITIRDYLRRAGFEL